jgi:hypothetical protein
MNVERSATRSLAEENPTYATTTPAAMPTTPAAIPTAPIHLLRTTLFTIARFPDHMSNFTIVNPRCYITIHRTKSHENDNEDD